MLSQPCKALWSASSGVIFLRIMRPAKITFHSRSASLPISQMSYGARGLRLVDVSIIFGETPFANRIQKYECTGAGNILIKSQSCIEGKNISLFQSNWR